MCFDADEEALIIQTHIGQSLVSGDRTSLAKRVDEIPEADEKRSFLAARSPMTRDDLRCFRALHGLTQSDLAEVLGIPRSAVIDFEKSRRSIPRWVGLALAADSAGLSPWEAPELARRQMAGRSRLRIDVRRPLAQAQDVEFPPSSTVGTQGLD